VGWSWPGQTIFGWKKAIRTLTRWSRERRAEVSW
jgi:hypothetical protein